MRSEPADLLFLRPFNCLLILFIVIGLFKNSLHSDVSSSCQTQQCINPDNALTKLLHQFHLLNSASLISIFRLIAKILLDFFYCNVHNLFKICFLVSFSFFLSIFLYFLLAHVNFSLMSLRKGLRYTALPRLLTSFLSI